MGEMVRIHNPPPQINELSSRITASYCDTVRTAVETAVTQLRTNSDPLKEGPNDTTIKTAVSSILNSITVAAQHEASSVLERAARVPPPDPGQLQAMHDRETAVAEGLSKHIDARTVYIEAVEAFIAHLQTSSRRSDKARKRELDEATENFERESPRSSL